MNMIWKEITEDRFDEMLGCVPPIRLEGCSFLNGEPLDCNRHGQNIYSAFTRVANRYFQSQCTTNGFEPFVWISEIRGQFSIG